MIDIHDKLYTRMKTTLIFDTIDGKENHKDIAVLVTRFT